MTLQSLGQIARWNALFSDIEDAVLKTELDNAETRQEMERLVNERLGRENCCNGVDVTQEYLGAQDSRVDAGNGISDCFPLRMELLRYADMRERENQKRENYKDGDMYISLGDEFWEVRLVIKNAHGVTYSKVVSEHERLVGAENYIADLQTPDDYLPESVIDAAVDQMETIAQELHTALSAACDMLEAQTAVSRHHSYSLMDEMLSPEEKSACVSMQLNPLLIAREMQRTGQSFEIIVDNATQRGHVRQRINARRYAEENF